MTQLTEQQIVERVDSRGPIKATVPLGYGDEMQLEYHAKIATDEGRPEIILCVSLPVHVLTNIGTEALMEETPGKDWGWEDPDFDGYLYRNWWVSADTFREALDLATAHAAELNAQLIERLKPRHDRLQQRLERLNAGLVGLDAFPEAD
jgi:hypothetical protein